MGLVYADITLENSVDAALAKQGKIANEDIKKIAVKALVDSGASLLTISDKVAQQLGLEIEDRLRVELADGSRSTRDLVGPVTIRFQNRITSCSALVFPGIDEVLLGAIPMQGMDVVIDPFAEQLMVHPDRPHRALLKVK
jgi:clan AA aspartic protease